MGDSLLNTPINSSLSFHIEVIRHSDIYTVQKAYLFVDGTCPVYIRTQTNGTWNAWRLFNPGTANTGQVLAGYTFSSANGVNLTGTLKLTINNLDWVNLSGGIVQSGSPTNYISGVVPSGLSGNVIVIGFSSVVDPNTPTPTQMTINGVSQPLWRPTDNGGVAIGVASPGSTVVLYGTSQGGPQYMYIHYGVPY